MFASQLHTTTSFTVEDDFHDVLREVVTLQDSYYQFGVELALPLRELDSIQKAFHEKSNQAFTEVLRTWVMHRYNIDKYGPPTWRRLVEAVDRVTGGNDHELAKKIALNHPACKYNGTVLGNEN